MSIGNNYIPFTATNALGPKKKIGTKGENLICFTGTFCRFNEVLVKIN